MKLFFLSVCCLFLISCQQYTDEVNFKLPEIPYSVSGEAATKKEFTFPPVPYAN
jgi:hypothetical protein